MKLSPVPDLASRRQVMLVALGVWLLAAAGLAATHAASLPHSLGDTDDALRLVMVRRLADGAGWFDQKLVRLQPPAGLYMHWSRLVDGGEAALLKLFAVVLPAASAEIALRLVWPLLWILPPTLAALLAARRLGGGAAVFVGALTAALAISLSGEYLPGRVDHHNIQIACAMLAFAAAVQRPSVGWTAVSAAATALGLAVGLEALAFHALIGAALALGWAFGRRDGRSLAVYGATLAVGAAALHLVQTPPPRWGLPACDALAVNLVVGLAVAGFGLSAAARLGAGAGTGGRLALVVVVGALAGATYLALDSFCAGGPMAAVEPQVKVIWLPNVREMTPWLAYLKTAPQNALRLADPVVVALAGWLWLGRRRDVRRDEAWMLSGALLVASVALTLGAVRFSPYAEWFAAPVAAAALAEFGAVWLASRMVPVAALAVAVSVVPAVALGRMGAGSGPAAGAPSSVVAADDPCYETAAFAPLRALPPGLALSEIDEGPFIVAETKLSALAGPYHRMGYGMLAAHAALAAPTAEAERRIRALDVAYVIDCPAHASQSDRTGLAADALQAQLDRGRPPSWLAPLSRPGDVLQVYGVRNPWRASLPPPSPASATPAAR